VKRDLIGWLGVALFIVGCVLFITFGAGPGDRTYPLAQHMSQLWSPDALLYVNLYLSVLAVCVGVNLVLVCISGLGSRDGTKKSRLGRAVWVALVMALVVGVVLWTLYLPLELLYLLAMTVLLSLLSLVGWALRSRSDRDIWVALVSALVVGVVLANLSGWAFPPPDPCVGFGLCPAWNPGPFRPPIAMLLHTAPLVVLTVLGTSILLSLVGFFMAWRTRSTLTPMGIRGLQLAPVLVVIILGLVALFLFPLPYSIHSLVGALSWG
jgi:hypothetical protein